MTNFINLTGVTDFTKMPNQIRERLETLTPRERKYFMTMWPKSGVLYIQSKPGIAKSAISRSIADKMGFAYLDLRLSMADETDFKFPYLKDKPSTKLTDLIGVMMKVSGYSIPEWAYEANQKPTIIHFEELNRAPQFVRNAALQILLERQIGDFKFNDTVLMMASGNLGDEDGTDVEEFDSALNNRLIHFVHSLGTDEWLDNYAKQNCHSLIYSYIRAYPEKLYQNPTENTKSFATPRSWTFLSDFITRNFGFDSNIREFLPFIQETAHGYVGNAAQHFLKYCSEMVNITIHDIINRYDKVEKELDKYNRDKNSELLASLREFNILDFTEKQTENVVKFLKRVGDDELTGYLLSLVDDKDFDVKNPKNKSFMSNFRENLKHIKVASKSHNESTR